MNTEAEFDLDKLFLPAWAQESPSYNKFAGHSGQDRPERGGGRRFDGPSGQRGGPRDGGGRASTREGGRPPRRDGDRPRPPGGGGRTQGGRRQERFDRFERREPAPLPEIMVTLMPDEKGVESLAKQIKMTGRAYPLFEIAKLILQKPERQQVKFEVVKKEGKVVQPLFVCLLDDTVWLSEQEAVNHALDKHFGTFYSVEKIQTEPPKGVFTFVAQCGFSGVILGPPNYHDYQTKLRKLHQERFSRMPFEAFKARVKIVRDEAVVKKWQDDQSWKTEYSTLNVPEAEMKKLTRREELETHFREVHLPNIIKEVETQTVSGVAGRKLVGPMHRVLRHAWEQQQRFPLEVVTYLSQQFAQRGLQFFKVNKFVTHVSIARPNHLDLEATPVSDCIRKIVEFIDTHAKCSRRALIEAVAPTPKLADGTPAPSAAEPTSEQNAVIADLHWLVHQGHVIEFANGTLETAKKPKPKPEPKKNVPIAVETVAEAQGQADTSEVKTMAAAATPVLETGIALEGVSASQSVPEFSASEIADLQKSAEGNLTESAEDKPSSTPAENV